MDIQDLKEINKKAQHVVQDLLKVFENCQRYSIKDLREMQLKLKQNTPLKETKNILPIQDFFITIKRYFPGNGINENEIFK